MATTGEKRAGLMIITFWARTAARVQISSMIPGQSGATSIAPWRALLAGADGMEGGHRIGAQPFDELGVGLDHRSMRKFAAAIGIERLGARS